MKLVKTIVYLIFLIPTWVIAQQPSGLSAAEMLAMRGEVYFQFQLDTDRPVKDQLERLTNIISIDDVKGNTVTAYANADEFAVFQQLDYTMLVMVPPSMLQQPRMLDDLQDRSSDDWDFYPTYDAYIAMMNQFVADYPDLCELVNIGTLVSEREILCIHINNNIGEDQNEPEFLYTSSMHGDELTGYVLSLRLIDYLLSNYGTLPDVTDLVDHVDIWINPLANPDGTFAGGNHTVYGATRGNANGIDFNRNFPDPENGPHPDGNAHQPETIFFMDFADAHSFVASANLHGGAEVCNYPWDTWPRLAADNDWWMYVCRQYADTVHAHAPAGYLTDLNNGITNGYAWYSINGGRQDYMNYFHHCREFTLEISSSKTPPAAQLPDFWEYNYRSLLNYMKQSNFGFAGTVTNSTNGNPIAAKVFVGNHDADESWVFASLPLGDYHRPIKAGTYDVTYSAFGYYSKTLSGIEPQDMQKLVLDVELDPYVSLNANFFASETLLYKGQSVDFTDASTGGNIVHWEWVFEGGDPPTDTVQHPEGITYADAGVYDVSLKVTDAGGLSKTLLKEQYIKVLDMYTIEETSIHCCEGLFFDSGGPEGNYADEEDLVSTIYPDQLNASIKLVFESFDVEWQNDCTADYLTIYNGDDINSPELGSWCGTLGPDSVTATNEQGALTLLFHSDNNSNASGWKAIISCDTSVGSTEKETDAQIVIYPMPATEWINIAAKQVIESIRIVDVSGKEIYQSTPRSNLIRLDLETFAKGLFFMQFHIDNQVEIHKLIVQ